MVAIGECFRNRREARVHYRRGSVSYPSGKQLGFAQPRSQRSEHVLALAVVEPESLADRSPYDSPQDFEFVSGDDEWRYAPKRSVISRGPVDPGTRRRHCIVTACRPLASRAAGD